MIRQQAKSQRSPVAPRQVVERENNTAWQLRFDRMNNFEAAFTSSGEVDGMPYAEDFKKEPADIPEGK